MRPVSNTRKRWLAAASSTVAVAAVAATAAGLFAGPALAVRAHAASSGPLIMESSQGVTLSSSNNMNPFLPGSAATQIGATSLIYEQLMQFDIAKPSQKPYPFLATSYKWGKGGKSITFQIRRGVKWSDGSLFTPADVAGTYNMLVKYPDTASITGIADLTGATVSGNAVTLKFKAPAYTELQQICDVYIVPSSIYDMSTDPASADITNPIGTGPYTYNASASNASGIVLNANPNYWGGPFGGHGAPAVKEVEFPNIDTAADALTALENNSLDWAGNALAGLSAFTSTAGHKIWFAAVNTVTLYPDLRTFPFNNLAVRKAVSLAMNRKDISVTGEYGTEPVAVNASGLTLPGFAAYEAPALKAKAYKLSPKSNPKAADAVLKAAGAKLKGGWYYINGKKIVISISDPTTYTDYAEDAKLISAELRAAHVDAYFNGMTADQWNADVADGHYGSAIIHWGDSVISPYGVYNYWLNSTLNNGKTNDGDFEGLKNKALDKDLSKLAGVGTRKAEVTNLTPLEEYVAKQLPVIAMVYGASFDEYNSGAFTGWPTASNQYESGSPNTPTNEVIVLHLKPTS
ncbi:MAG: ABC transporter substrate-binding protein [Solirubrobacteraceae bacterium]